VIGRVFQVIFQKGALVSVEVLGSKEATFSATILVNRFCSKPMGQVMLLSAFESTKREKRKRSV
jgi:hypothetical protein